jgi:hypothetical protein
MMPATALGVAFVAMLLGIAIIEIFRAKIRIEERSRWTPKYRRKVRRR